MRTAAMPMLALAGLLGLGAGCRTKLRCYAHEQCGPNMVCTPDERCVPNLCGDGILLGEEVCDDGNAAGGDGCAADCRSDESCGNGLVDEDAGEVCDDGNTAGGDGCSADCRSYGTGGDGTVDTAAGETCDDGDTAPDDGRFVVVWESYGQDGDFSGIYAQKFTVAGVPVGAGPW